MKQTYSGMFVAMGIVCSVCLVVSNILAVKQFDITVFGHTVPSTAGLIIFPISYIINDCISEVWGYSRTRFLIWIAFATNLLAVVMFQVSVMLPPSPHWTDMQPAYASVLAQTPRIALASMVAFLMGSFLNAFVMSKMKLRQQGRHFWWRAIVSTVVGELADTLCFTCLGFLGVIPTRVVFAIVVTETILKTAFETVALPVTVKVVRYVKQREETDVYDNNISYNPFKL